MHRLCVFRVFGLSGSLDDSFQKSKPFYVLFTFQLLIALVIVLFPGIQLFSLAVTTQTINAIALPFVFYFLIKLTSDSQIMGEYANTRFQKSFAIIGIVTILVASFFTAAILFIHF